jgi:hypothetical protein
VSNYTTQSSDTSEDVERLLIESYRAMAPWEKLAIARDLSMTSQVLALAGLRIRHPSAGSEELRMRLAAFRLPPDLLKEALGWSAPSSP